MNEEKYTRDSAKKSTRKKKVNPDIHAGKSHGEKLKNDSSAARSYRDKIRYGKKDNSLSVSEAKELRSMKKQGRRRIYKNQAVAATVRKTTIKNEDENSGTDSLNAGLAAVETGIGKVREHGQARKYSSKIHNRSDHLDAVQGARGAKEAGEAGESTMSATVKKTRKKLMQREFAEAAAKKQAKFSKKEDSYKEKIDQLEDRVKRQMAEFENFRKRTDKEKQAMFDTGAKSVIEKILPVVDNFERGLATVPEESKEDPFVDGMNRIYKQLMTELENIGVKPIEAVGQEFDPNLHNAVMQVESDEYESGVVAQELQKGYTYHDMVVRHSMVGVVQ